MLLFYYKCFSSGKLERIGQRLLGNAWNGVHPLDKLPYLIEGGYIVNTQTSNLDGEHWLAFYIKPMEILVFDPYGFYYPALLVTKLQSVGKNIHYNRNQYQSFNTKDCGQHCLKWLCMIHRKDVIILMLI